MKKIKHIIAMAVCLAILFSLAGCASETGEADSDNTASGVADMVYVPEYQYIDDDIGNLVISGDRLYGSCWSYDEETLDFRYRLARWNLDTLEKEELPYIVTNGNIYQMSINEDGTFLLLVYYSGEEKSGYYLVTLDENGEEKSEIQIDDLIDSYNTDSDFGMYPQYMETDEEGNIYLYISSFEGVLIVLDSEGNRKFDLPSQDWCIDLVAGQDGVIYFVTYDSSGTGSSYCLKAVDTAAKTWGETYTGIPTGSGSFLLSAEDETHFLVSSGDILYRYDLTAQTAEQILNWLDCDINASSVQDFAVLEDGRILVTSYNWTGDSTRYELAMLTAREASQVQEKTVITYGTLYLDYEIREKIIEFNKTNGEYRIGVKDYSAAGDSGEYDYSAGLNAFHADLAAGNAPDLIDLSSLDFTTYADKGVFADLYTFLENDGTISREDLVANPLKIYEVDGKLYGIPMSFSIQTLLGRTSALHGKTGWTVQDVQEIMAEQPEGTMFMEYASRDSILWTLISYQLDQYVDWSSGTCSFDGEEFINTLNFIAGFPSAEEINYEEWGGTYTNIHNGKVLVTMDHIYSIGEFLATLAMYDGDDVTCIGYPTADGSNGSMISGSCPFAISASSKNPEGAWAFIKSLLSEEYQNQMNFNGFPILQSALDAYLDRAMTDYYAGNGFGWGDFQYEQVPATQEQIDLLRNLIDTAKPMNSFTDSNIINIISEEVTAFFDGQKTAEAVADIIQSRVSIYVSENY